MIYKLRRGLQIIFLPLGYFIAVPLILMVRLLSPWIIIRWACLISTRIGHFAMNTELYCCERDESINTPSKRHIDLFWLYPSVCNRQLTKLWKRQLKILPLVLMHPLNKLNELLNEIISTNGNSFFGYPAPYLAGFIFITLASYCDLKIFVNLIYLTSCLPIPLLGSPIAMYLVIILLISK